MLCARPQVSRDPLCGRQGLMVAVLREDEFGLARNARELREWVLEVHRALGETVESKTALRLETSPLIKRFKHEICPLSSYAWLFHRDRTDLLFQPVLGNQPYDAQILDRATAACVQRVEITVALDGEIGYQEHLRMHHLVQHGRAPATGAVFLRNPDGSVPEVPFDMVNHDEARDQVLEQVRIAIARKLAKQYKEQTFLIVEFSGVHFAFPEDREAVRSFASNQLGVAPPFTGFALVEDGARFGVSSPPLTLKAEESAA